METASAILLVSKLRMGTHLDRLLDSDAAYSRFEKAIESSLSHIPPGTYVSIRIPTIGIRNNRKFLPSFIFIPNPKEPFVYGRRAVLRDTYKKAVKMFAEYYGIGQKQKTLDEISTQFGLDKSTIGGYIDFVTTRLIQRHRQDIWYATL